MQDLIRKFKSIKRLKEAAENEIAEVVGPAKAKILVAYFTDNKE